MLKLFFNTIVFLIVSLSSAYAQANSVWEIRQISGRAWLVEDASQTERPLQKHTKLQPGQTLKTGDRTRVLLARDKERIQVGSNTILSIPKTKQDQPNTTTIKLKTGKIDLIVKKRPQWNFTVDTPLVAAVVKGTRFTVTTSAQRSLVRVFEGLVGVVSHISEETADIRPGKSASLTFSSQAPSRLLLLDNPQQAKLFENYPEVFEELSIPNPNIGSGGPSESEAKLSEELTLGGILSGFVALVLSAIGGVFYAIGNMLSVVFTPILTPALEIIDNFYDVIVPNSMPLLLAFIAVIGLGIGLIIALSIRKRRH